MRKTYNANFKTKLVLKLLREEKTLAQSASDSGLHPNQLRNWRDLVLQQIHTLFEKKEETTQLRAAQAAEREELYAEIGRVRTQLTWVKKKLASEMSRAERQALVERSAAALSLTEQAELLGLSRSSLYDQAVGPAPAEIALKHRIDELYTARPFYGSRRIHAQLRRAGETISRQRVQRYMREMGIAGVCPGPNLSRRNQAHQVYPYLLRGLPIERVNQVWGTDITYIRLQGGWLYLVAILDWYSRYVVSWELDLTLELGFVQRAVNAAFAQTQPEILNSDQGSHFTSDWYVERVQEQGVQIRMDGKGRAIDNIFTERFWRTLKYEDVYLKDYESPRLARQGLSEYFQFYNHERPHQSLGYRTPAEIYFGEKGTNQGQL